MTLKGIDRMKQMAAIMKEMREQVPAQLLCSPVVLIHDYLKGETTDMVSDLRYAIKLPKSDVIQFISTSNTVVTVRPSGTEPKIKFYFGVRTQLDMDDDWEKTDAFLEEQLEKLEEEIVRFH